jgi:hypothetical protein
MIVRLTLSKRDRLSKMPERIEGRNRRNRIDGRGFAIPLAEIYAGIAGP